MEVDSNLCKKMCPIDVASKAGSKKGVVQISEIFPEPARSKKETKQRDLPRVSPSLNETDVPPNGFSDPVVVAFVNQTRKQMQANKIQTRDRDVGSCVEHCRPEELDDHEELASPLKPLLDGFSRSTAAFPVAALDVLSMSP